MYLRITARFSSCLVLLALCLSCQGITEAAPLSNPTSADTVVRLHWLGKDKVSADTNAAGLMKIWNAPESVRLEADIIGKLASAPRRLLGGKSDPASTNLLHPLVEDIVHHETYVEIRRAANSPEAGEMVLAVRLDAGRSAMWETNLAAALHLLTGIAPVKNPDGKRWALKKHHAPDLLEYARVGEWTVVGAGQGRNGLLEEMVARIEKERLPFHAAKNISWLEGEVDLPFLVTALRPEGNWPGNLPKISFAMIGDGLSVSTRGLLRFSQPLPMVLKPWNVPTNFMGSDLSSFTAVRGVGSLLLSDVWKEFETNSPPNQFYFWSENAVPMESYCAAPLADASNAVLRLSEFTLKKGSPLFAQHDMVRFRKAKTFNGIEWAGVPFVYPFLRSAETAGGNYILAGFFPLVVTNQPSSPFFRELPATTNLIYFDREHTGTRLEQLTYVTQFLRLAIGRPELAGDSAALGWLQSMSQKLGTTGTEITRQSEREFSYARKSSVGFTAIEIQWLADWVESPEFPSRQGWHPHRPEVN
jgi:hypothetical protein